MLSQLHLLRTVDHTGVSQVIPAQVIVQEVVYRYAETVVAGILFPRITGHQTQLVYIVEGLVKVDIGLKGLIVAEVSTTLSHTVHRGSYIAVLVIDLGVVRMVGTIGSLVVIIRIVGIPSQTIDDVQRSLS